MTAVLPRIEGGYGAILADPPWAFQSLVRGNEETGRLERWTRGFYAGEKSAGIPDGYGH